MVAVVVEVAFSGSFLRDLDEAFLAFSASSRCSKLSQVGLVPCPLLPLVPFAPFTGALDTEIGTNSAPSVVVMEESASEESVTTSLSTGCRSSTDGIVVASMGSENTSGVASTISASTTPWPFANAAIGSDLLIAVPHGEQPVAQGACQPLRSTACHV